MSSAKLMPVPGTGVNIDDAVYHLQKARALADVLMALTNYTNDPSHNAPINRTNPETLHWIAVQQFDLACEALNIVERHVDGTLSQRHP